MENTRLIGDRHNFIESIFEMEKTRPETIARHKEEDRNENRKLQEKIEIDAVWLTMKTMNLDCRLALPM